MPVEDVVHVLAKLHEALVPGGLLVDTQPVSRHPIVRCADRRVGSLDMTGWGRTIDRVERRTQKVIRAGLFELVHQERVNVIDRFDTGIEMQATASEFAGTVVPDGLARRLQDEHSPIALHLAVRLRVLRMCPQATMPSTV